MISDRFFAFFAKNRCPDRNLTHFLVPGTFPTRFCEPLAQSVEHLAFNQRVEGSNPSRLTMKLFNSTTS